MIIRCMSFLICSGLLLLSRADAQSAPRDVYFQSHSLNYFTVSWTLPLDLTGITGYVLVYTVSPGTAPKQQIIDGNAITTTTTLQDNDLMGNAPISVLLAPMMNGNINGANIVQASPPPPAALPPAPADATVQRTSGTSYQLTWNNGPGTVDGYVISYATTTGGDISSLDLRADMTSEQITNLMQNIDYFFNLYSQRNGLRTQATLTTLPPVTQVADPKPPENFYLYQISTSSVLLRWDPPSPPDNSFVDYVVSFLNSVTGEGEDTVLPSAVTSFVIRDLQGGILYDFRVVTQTGNMRSIIVPFIPLPLDTSAAFELTVGAVTDRKLHVSWQHSVANVEYVVHLFKDDGTEEFNQAVQSSTSTVMEGLTPDSSYIIVIESMSTSSVLGSDVAMTNIQLNSNVVVDSMSSTSATLSWAAFPMATNYRISYIGQDNAVTGVLNSPSPTSTVTGLQPQTTYTFSVVAITGTGEQNVGSVVGTTGLDGADPKPPENFYLYQISTSSVLLRWDPPSPPDNSFVDYVVSFLNSVTGEGEDTVLPSTVTSFVIRDLQGGILYDFRVVTQIGNMRSIIVPFIPLPLDATALFELIVGAVTDRKLHVSWQHSVANVEYVVHLFKDDGTEELNQAVQTSSNTVIEGLTPDSSYIIVIESMSTSSVLGSDVAMTNTIPNSNVMVDSTTSTIATLSWAAFPMATNYRISYISQDNAVTGVLNSPSPMSTVTGLQPQTTYTFSVVATAGTVEANVGSVVRTTAAETSVVRSSFTSNTITLSWNNVENTTVYQIFYRSIVPGGLEDQRGALTNTTTLSGLTPMTQYNITVYAYTSNLGRLLVGSIITSTGATTPTTQVTAAAVTSTTATLSWTAVPGNTGYQIFLTRADGEQRLVSSALESTTLQNLTPGSSYNVRVVTSAGGVQVEVGTTTFSTTQVSVNGVTSTTAILTWTTVPGNTGYQITYTDVNGVQRSASSGTESVTLVNLSPASSYNVRVVTNSGGVQVEVGTAAFNTVPGGSGSVTVNSVTSTTASLTWTPLPGTNVYQIIYSTTDGMETTVSSVTNGATLVNLTPGTTYTIRVQVNAPTGTNVIGSTTITTIAPQINVNEITSTTATLSWTAVPGNTGYQIFYTRADGFQQTTSTFPGEESTTLQNLTPGSSYNVRVRANNGIGGQVEVGTTTFSTSPSNSVTVNNITPSTATLSWTALPGSPVYEIANTGPDGVERTVTSGTNSVTISGLIPGSSYTFRVQAAMGATIIVVGTATANTEPTSVTVETVSTSTARLTWTLFPGNLGYRIIYINTGPGGVEMTVASATNSVTLIGLNAGAFYNVRVEANTGTGTTIVIGTSVVNTDTQPFVFANDVTSTTASLSWVTISGNPMYVVFYTDPNGEQQSVVTSSSSADLTGLTPGTAYDVLVRANLPQGMGTSVIGTLTFNTDLLTSSPSPRDVYFQSHELDFFTISWTPGDLTDVTGYLVAYTSGSSGFQDTIDDRTATTITLQDDTLAGDPPTGVLVVPFVAPSDMTAGRVNTSYLVQAVIPPDTALPPAPTSATVRKISGTSYELNWVSAPGVDGYVISYATTTRDEVSSVDVPVGRTLEQITNLMLNTDYTFFLYSQKNGLRRRANLTTLPPDIRTSNLSVNSTANTITISWPAVQGNILYQISYTDPNGNLFQTATTSETITLTDLFEGTSYNISVRSFTNTQPEEVGTVIATTMTTGSSDTTPPVVICPSDIIEVVEIGSTFAEINVPLPTATDNSGTVVFVSSNLPTRNQFPIGTTSVAYTYRDLANNLASCTVSVTVSSVDITPPVVICPANIFETVAAGVSSQSITFPSTATAADNSGSVTLVSTIPPSGSAFSVGTTPVTYTYTDPSGNLGSCTFDVTVITTVDITPPLVTCPPNIFETIAAGATSASITFPSTATATDNSGSATLVSVIPPSGSPFLVRTTPVTYTFSDPSGNLGSCTFNVTVSTDAQPSGITVISVTQNSITISWPPVDANIIYQIFYPVPGGIPLQTASVSETITLTGLLEDTLYNITVRGNTNTQQVHVGSRLISTLPSDTTAPTVTCPPDLNRTVELGTTSAEIIITEPTVTDNSGTVTLVGSTLPGGNRFPIGVTTVTYTYRDLANNQASCTVSVTVALVDTFPPSVVCPPTVFETVAPGVSSVLITLPSATASDISGITILVSTTPPSGSPFPVGTTPVTYTYSDSIGNQASCTFDVTVTVSTGTQPSITVVSVSRDSITISWPAVEGNLVYQIFYTDPGETQFQTASLSENVTLSGLLEGTSYNITVRGNTITGPIDVGTRVVSTFSSDTTPPVVACPQNITRTVILGTASVTIEIPVPSASDDSGMVQLVDSNLPPGNQYPLGVTNVAFAFADLSGNTASCSLTVTVVAITQATGVMVDFVSPDSITLSWPVVPSNFLYQILYTDPNGNQFQTTTTNETVTLTGLLEGTPYNIIVRGFNNSGQVDVGTVIATTSTGTGTTTCSSAPCANLGTCINVLNGFRCICRAGFTGTQCELNPLGSSLAVSDLGTDFITLTWDNDPTQNILSYILTLTDATGTNVVVPEQPLAPEPTLSYRFMGLQPGTQYTVDVDVVVGFIRNQFASETFYTRPKPPENIILYTLSNAAALLRWDPPSSPDNYFEGYLVVSQDLSTGAISSQTTLPSTVGSYVINGLQNGVPYDFTVLSTIGTSITSPFTEFPFITLGAPANMSVGAVTAQELEVVWTVPQVYAQYNVVHLFNEDGTEEHSQTVGVGNSSVVFQNLTPDTVYLAVLETVSASSQLSYVSGWDLASTNILSGSTVIVVSTDSLTATLSWAFIPTATGYVVSYISQSGADTGTFTLATPINIATVPGLQPDTIYTFSVVATSDTTVTNVGTAVGTTTFFTEVVIGDVTFSAIMLSWTNVPEGLFYQVSYQDQNGLGGQTGAVSNTTTITGLAPTTTYNIMVVALTPQRQVDVGSATVTTELEPTVAIITITSDTAVLIWSPLQGALVYTVTYTDGMNTFVRQTIGPTAEITGLTHNTTYEFSVDGFGQGGEMNLGSISATTAVDLCASSPCQNGAQCTDGGFSVTCQCEVGYFGTFCETAIQCVIPTMPNALNTFDGQCIGPSTIDFGQSCTYHCDLGFVIRGEPTLSCQPDGTLDGVFPSCEDVNECRNGLMCEDPNSFCLNNVGSFMCICNDGFQLMSDGTCQASTTISCPADLCQNGGTCVTDPNRVVCVCPVEFTGPVCEIDLSCGGVSCGSSQVCVNEQCTCLEGFILESGLCQSPCSPSCDLSTEICMPTPAGGFECDCRPDRERSFWTGLCVLRSRTFVSVFTIDELGGSPVDFNPAFADPTSMSFQNGSAAVTGVLPLAFQSGGMTGVIGVDVGGFFQGSLMCEIRVFVGADFDGSAADLERVLKPNDSSPRLADDTHELVIRKNSVTLHEMTNINPCKVPELSDCSENAECRKGDGIGYICICLEGYRDIFPESLPGRYCVEDTHTTNAPGTDSEPGSGITKRSLFIGIVSSIVIIIIVIATVFCFNLIRIHREEYKVKKRTAARDHSHENKAPEGCVQSSVPDVFFKKSSFVDKTYINSKPQLDEEHPSAFNLEARNHAMIMD